MKNNCSKVIVGGTKGRKSRDGKLGNIFMLESAVVSTLDFFFLPDICGGGEMCFGLDGLCKGKKRERSPFFLA